MADWHFLCNVSDCPAGTAREFIVGSQIVALFCVEDVFFALDGICPHQGGPLGKGTLDGCMVTCPWHGFQFDVRHGIHKTTPGLRLPTIPVRVEQDMVYVSLPIEDPAS